MYKITNIDNNPCQRFIYKNGFFEWKINHYIDEHEIVIDEDEIVYFNDRLIDTVTFSVLLFKNKVTAKFDTIQ